MDYVYNVVHVLYVVACTFVRKYNAVAVYGSTRVPTVRKYFRKYKCFIRR